MHLKRVFISAEVQIVKKTIHAKQWEHKFNFAIKISNLDDLEKCSSLV